MKRKIISICVFMLMIAMIWSVQGTENNEKTLSRNINNFHNSGYKGTTFYACKVDPIPVQLVSFDPTQPEIFNNISITTSERFLSGGCFVEDVWYACEYSKSNSKLWKINKTTGEMRLLRATGEGLNGLAYDSTTGTLYGCGSSNLYRIDLTTFLAVFVGQFGIDEGSMIGITCDGNGRMYGLGIITNSLYTIDTFSGKATLVGKTGLALYYAQDIGYDIENNILYLAGYANAGALYTLNTITGEATKIGFFPGRADVDALAIPYYHNQPPNSPTITGSTEGTVGLSTNYTFTALDPNGNKVYYFIDWGDNTNSNWIGPYSSGEQITQSHSWSTKGDYIIKAEAKDIYGDESDWATLTVTMPCSYKTIPQFLQLLFQRFPHAFPLLRQLMGY